MKKWLFVCSMSIACLSAQAQFAVTDPTSMAQRTVLFLEQMEEALSQTVQLGDQLETARQGLEMAKRTKERLQKVSRFVQQSAEVIDITAAGVRIAGKIGSYEKEIRQFDHLTTEEQFTVIADIISLGSEAVKKVDEGMKLFQQEDGDGEFNDYERLQLIKNAKEEVLCLENTIDDTYNKAASQKSYAELSDGMFTLFENASLFLQ